MDVGDAAPRSFTTYFPAPLVHRMRRGDVLALQICHLEQNHVWVPYMYSYVSVFLPPYASVHHAAPAYKSAMRSSVVLAALRLVGMMAAQ